MFKFDVWPTQFRMITQPFGVRKEFYSRFGLPGHEGIDFHAPEESQVFCVAPGRVSMVQRIVGTASSNPYGRHVIVEHADGYRTTYAHLSTTMVNIGQEVDGGTMVGLAGNTGNSFGAHLHLTLQKTGEQAPGFPHNIVDPTPFILPFLGWQEPAGPFTTGWAFVVAITAFDRLAQVNASPINLRTAADMNSDLIAQVPAGTIMIVTGEQQGDYLPVLVPNAAIGRVSTPPPDPLPELPPMVATVDGWGFTQGLNITGNMAVVGTSGINLRGAPRRDAVNIGLVRGGTTAEIRGDAQGEYTPVRVSQNNFIGPVNLPAAAPAAGDEAVIRGWGITEALTISGRQAVVGRFGINLRRAPDRNATKLGLVKEAAVVTVFGRPRGEYTPVEVRQPDILNLPPTLPDIELPEPFSETLESLAAPAPSPSQSSTAGWAFTAGIRVNEMEATAGMMGINLRAAPRRDAENLGFVPAGTLMIATGAAQGEYTPVRVDNAHLRPSLDITAPNHPEPHLLGQAHIGLHASADPFIPAAEFEVFRTLRPGIIKVLSFHSGSDIARLATEHPQASWIVRAFLNFGGRTISPQQFFNDTVLDVRRALDALAGREVVIELHNEPNLVIEGMGNSWSDGAAFSRWFLEVLQRYRAEFPTARFIYPGLSPGNAIPRVRQANLPFLEAGRTAVATADGLGVHLYWAFDFPMSRTLSMLDDLIHRFPTTPIYVTEASNNKGQTSPAEKARQYLQFWAELQKRPTVRGVTYFVASATNPDFAEEVWTGRGIAEIVGAR
jgi:murein DD-endopeptidase MepM/ murein hydrolase activator NlpD